MISKGTILLCAGGTGGHPFPAQAVAEEMVSRGYQIHLAADKRVERFAGRFPCEEIHQISSATFASKSPIAIARTAWALFSGYQQSKALIRRITPAVVAGFGGYPTVPPVLAAARIGLPTLVHEANAVLGRANRFLAPRVDQVAMGFGKAAQGDALSVTVTGNPVRPEIMAAADTDYSQREAHEPFNLLVFGGSQGAAFFGELLPKAIEMLPEEIRVRLKLVQQARPEDLESVKSAYRAIGVTADVASFFTDMADHLRDAHLVISRAGASTVSELAIMGRPAFLVPYPHALDHDQAENAAAMAGEGGAILFKQAALTPAVLVDELTKAIKEPKKLALAAKNAKKTGKPEATSKLADMLEALAAK